MEDRNHLKHCFMHSILWRDLLMQFGCMTSPCVPAALQAALLGGTALVCKLAGSLRLRCWGGCILGALKDICFLTAVQPNGKLEGTSLQRKFR